MLNLIVCFQTNLREISSWKIVCKISLFSHDQQLRQMVWRHNLDKHDGEIPDVPKDQAVKMIVQSFQLLRFF